MRDRQRLSRNTERIAVRSRAAQQLKAMLHELVLRLDAQRGLRHHRLIGALEPRAQPQELLLVRLLSVLEPLELLELVPETTLPADVTVPLELDVAVIVEVMEYDDDE